MTKEDTVGAMNAAKEIMEGLPLETLAERCEVWNGPNPNAEPQPCSLREIIWDRHKSLQVEQAIAAVIDHETGLPEKDAVCRQIIAYGEGIGQLTHIIAEAKAALAKHERSDHAKDETKAK